MKKEIFLIKDPLRVRKLLMHKAEIMKLTRKGGGKRLHFNAAPGIFQGRKG